MPPSFRGLRTGDAPDLSERAILTGDSRTKANARKQPVFQRITRLSALWAVMASLVLVAPALGASRPPVVDPVLKAPLKKAVSDPRSFRDRYSAEVWLMDMSQRLKSRIPNDAFRMKLLENVHYEAIRAGLKPELVLSVIQVESNFHRFAISSAGARGLMQVMPFWLKEIGKPGDDLFRVQTNLRYGCTILKYYLDKEHGNLSHALALYNGSPGRDRYVAQVYQAFQRSWFSQ